MSSAVARLLFIVALILQLALFSQSRYGQFHEAHDAGHSLVKRISTELSNGPTVFSSSGNECMPVYIPTPDQCTYVQENCSTSNTFLHISYLRRYFCADLPIRPLVFTGLVIWLMFLFSTLGISASDFFTPNLATIAQVLRLDENVAGVTFLAFGNGSPDVFSTFSAMRADSGSLAIGELLGAATFIVSCVVGSMCIIKPFQVHKGPFLRDVGFFSVAVAMLLVILWDEQIRPWESVSMIILYLFYVFVVVVGAWWDRKSQRKRLNEALARAEYEDEEASAGSFFDEPYRDDPSSISSVTLSPPSPRARAISNPGPPRLRTHDLPRRGARTPSPTNQMSSSSISAYSHLPSFSLVGALEFREVIASLKTEAATTSLDVFDSPVTPYAGGHYHRHSLSHSRSYSRVTPRTPMTDDAEVDPWDRTLGSSTHQRSGADTPLVEVNTPAGSDTLTNGHSHVHGRSVSPMPSITRTPASPTTSDTQHEGEIQLFPFPLTKKQRAIRVIKDVYHTIFPSLHNFKNQSFLARTAALFAAPAVLMLTLTLPVVVTPYEHAHSPIEKRGRSNHTLMDYEDFEEDGIDRVLVAEEEMEEDRGIGFNKWLTAAQAIFGPLFCVSVLFSGNTHQFWLSLAVGITGLAAAALIVVFAGNGDHPSFRMARCSVGFFVSMVWIMAIADEVVQVLRTFGFVFGLSDAIIGLTIFAVGNSLADLVANMSVAVFAPIMGFSACFGGPMLNILLGVGFSGTYITSQTSKPYALHFGTTLFVSGIGLLVLLAATLLFVPLNGYVLTRAWGIFLIISYTVIIVTNVVVELNT